MISAPPKQNPCNYLHQGSPPHAKGRCMLLWQGITLWIWLGHFKGFPYKIPLSLGPRLSSWCRGNSRANSKRLEKTFCQVTCTQLKRTRQAPLDPCEHWQYIYNQKLFSTVNFRPSEHFSVLGVRIVDCSNNKTTLEFEISNHWPNSSEVKATQTSSSIQHQSWCSYYKSKAFFGRWTKAGRML